ncbi:MAG TPA: cytochrome c oxidase assembly protein [Acidimicrobiales bacterium]|nr:cytochrome c oxidase assembly protein [Acidimicrobiales bacterium]
MTAPPEPSWPALLARWSVEPPVVAGLVLAAVAYLAGRRSRGPADRSRPGLFIGGLAATGVALLSPLATYAEALLSVHMAQHLLLVLGSAPLLVAARPGEPLLAVLPAEVAARLRAAGRSAPVRALTSPLVAWGLFAATGWAVHFTGLFDLALRNPAVHAAEHVLFLGSGILFWLPVLGPRRMSHPLRLLYLAMAMPQNTFLALAIYSAGRPLYQAYGELGRTWGPSLLDDQRHGAGFMWVVGDLTLLVAVLAVTARWATADARRELDVDVS